jgi:hypothetical protein
MEQEMGIEEARGRLGPLARQALNQGMVTHLTSHGTRIAKIVPEGDDAPPKEN